MTQTAPSVAQNRSDGVSTIVVGSGHHRNALGVSDWEELRSQAENLARDKLVRVVILRGDGQSVAASDGRPTGAPVVDFEPFRQAVGRFLAKDKGAS